MTLVDIVIIAVIVISTLAAISQGFFREIFSLVGLVIGLVVASWNYARLAIPLARLIHSPGIAEALAFLLIALVIMLIAGLIGTVLSKAVHGVGLGGLDRLLGAVFGLVRGCVLVMVAMIAIAAFRPGAPWMQGSRLAPYFLPGARVLSTQAPAELKEKIALGITIIEHPKSSWIQLNMSPNNPPSHE
ncbi:MAG TPA: CvpA family protein [Acidobacteriaceae bacterium]|jgi:membrane protein required for colicin V production|nr:CvpA family protein [Acidobacteriaceae bacterium]